MKLSLQFESASIPENRTLLGELHDICGSLEGLESSTEAIKSLNALIDVFSRLLNSLKTNVFKSYRAVKRSELRAYIENNPMKIRATDKLMFTDIAGVRVDFPQGMTTAYNVTMKSLKAAFKSLDAIENVYLCQGVIEAVYRELTRTAGSPEDLIADNVSEMTAYLKRCKKSYDSLKKLFNDKSTTTQRFDKLFDSTGDYTNVRKSLLNMEINILSVPGLIKTTEKIDRTVSEITTVISTDPSQYDKKFIKQLADYIKAVAGIIDMYGELVTTQVVLEHNITYVCDALYAKVE